MKTRITVYYKTLGGRNILFALKVSFLLVSSVNITTPANGSGGKFISSDISV
jgi:hypothetical protein